MGLGDILRREFFITRNCQIRVVIWIMMDLAMEMLAQNFQYYVQALVGTGEPWD